MPRDPGRVGRRVAVTIFHESARLLSTSFSSGGTLPVAATYSEYYLMEYWRTNYLAWSGSAWLACTMDAHLLI